MGLFYVCKGFGRGNEIATPKVKLQPDDGPHAGPKHVVVSPMH